MKPLVPVGEIEGVAHFYYPAIAEEMFVGYIASKGGFGYPGVSIQYSPEDLQGILRITRLMESQGRQPEVYFEPTTSRLEVAVIFKVSVGQEMALHLMTEGNHVIDLSQLRAEPKIELLATAETDVKLEGMDEILLWFKAQRFRVAICKMGSWGDEEIYWKTELNSYGEKRPDFFNRSH